MKKLTLSLLTGVAVLGFASTGFAADLIIEEPVAEVGVVDVGGNWDGAYVGVFGGAGWGHVDHTGVLPGLFDEPGADLDITGWLLGVRAGADFTVSDGIVLGVVGDLAWSNLSGEELFEDLNFGVDDALVGYELDWQGSLRARLGFDGGAFLPYVTAGLAFGHLNHTISIEGDPEEEGSGTLVGWTAGAGVEFAVVENVTLNLEYRYTDLGEKTIDMGLGANDPSFAVDSHTLTAGVNFRF